MATHHYSPTYYRLTLASNEPVLHIADGYAVVTTTVDAMGCNTTGNRITARGNP